MSYSVEFYGGDPARIARAVSDLELSLEWATMVASVPGDACDKVVDQWVKALAKNYGDPQMKPTDELRCAFAALGELCRRAKAERLPVVHVFML